ncbi:MAG: HAMP domain-containing protein [Coriobacteriia bacterium]|nr:HAMP domain-containing protein [Coriobacteriia bacterium]
MSAPPSTSSYRLRLMIGFTLVIGLLVTAWAWSMYSPLSAAVMEQQEQNLVAIAQAGSAAIAHSDLPLDEILREAAGDGTTRLTVIAADGTVLADSQENASALDNHSDRPEVVAALGGVTGTDVRRSDTQGVERMYTAVPATYGGTDVVFRASESLSYIDALSARARRTGLLLLTVVLVVAAGAASMITRSTARPVEVLAESAQAMADGDLTTPIPGDYGPLLPLSNALSELQNQLRERLTALEAERHTLRVALDGLSDAVLLLDGDRVQLANRAFGAMFQTPPGKLPGRRLSDLGLPASIQSAIAGRLSAPEATSVDLGPDPYQRYHSMVVVPLGLHDGVTRTLVVTSDVTDRMRLDAVRRDFVANASHELKTPTAAIGLLAESADQAARDGDEGQALAFAAKIGYEATRMQRLVSDLLDLSRIESTPDTEDVADVRRTLELALAAHRRSAAMKGLTLQSDLQGVTGVDVAVRCGTTDLTIALDNLLSNAITYTENGEVAVSVEADEDTVTINVADTGIGIPAADIERVFERFYRVDRARSRASGGTGLGLSLVRNVAEQAGGTVGITSDPGTGTTVTLRLPRAI